MLTKKLIKEEMESMKALKGLVEVYEEMAASRMQKVRGAVLQSRHFLDDLLDVFSRIKSAYKSQLKAGETLRRSNNQTVAVLISANAGLYGTIVDKVFEMFTEYVNKEKPNVVVLGKLGVKLMSEKLPGVLYNYFDFSDDEVDLESFDMVMRYVAQFERALVFYGKFRSILEQDPTITSVTGDAQMAAERQSANAGGVKVKYLFEPSVEEVARVFEGEILSSIFEQTLHESNLAKFASRLMALDSAVDKIDERYKGIGGKLRRVEKSERNRKQLFTISGINLWRYGR